MAEFITIPLDHEGSTVEAVRATRWTTMLLAGGDGPLAGLAFHVGAISATIVVLEPDALDTLITALVERRGQIRSESRGKPN